MGRSYLEQVFRHKLLMVIPAVLCVLVAGSMTFFAPRSYVATGTAWAEAPAGTELETWPSTYEQVLLTQMLSTRQFLQQVAAGTPLGDDLAGASMDERDAILSEIRYSIGSAPTGPDILTFSATSKDPQLAVALAASVVQQFNRTIEDRAKASSTDGAARAQAQLAVATENRATARKKIPAETAAAIEADSAAPLPPGTSPEVAAFQAAQVQYEASLSAAAEAKVAGAPSVQNRLTVVDEADRAAPQPRRKAFLLSVVGGGLAGLTLSFAAILFLMATDRRVRVPADLADALDLAVIAEIPEVQGMRPLASLTGLPAGDALPASEQ